MDPRSTRNLEGVHPDLVRVVRDAFALLAERNDGLGAIVTEGRRSITRQSELVKAGASRTMKSRHITGHAIDLAATVNGEVRWDWPLYSKLAAVMKQAAGATPLVWGGSWKSFPDGPHFELDRLAYPA